VIRRKTLGNENPQIQGKKRVPATAEPRQGSRHARPNAAAGNCPPRPATKNAGTHPNQQAGTARNHSNKLWRATKLADKGKRDKRALEGEGNCCWQPRQSARPNRNQKRRGYKPLCGNPVRVCGKVWQAALLDYEAWQGARAARAAQVL